MSMSRNSFKNQCNENVFPELLSALAGAEAGTVVPGFQSLPVAALKSAFKANSFLTASSMSGLAALSAFNFLTRSPWLTMELLISAAGEDPVDAGEAALEGAGAAPGFQSCPVAVLYSVFSANNFLTASSISGLAALSALSFLTISP